MLLFLSSVTCHAIHVMSFRILEFYYYFNFIYIYIYIFFLFFYFFIYLYIYILLYILLLFYYYFVFFLKILVINPIYVNIHWPFLETVCSSVILWWPKFENRWPWALSCIVRDCRINVHETSYMQRV